MTFLIGHLFQLEESICRDGGEATNGSRVKRIGDLWLPLIAVCKNDCICHYFDGIDSFILNLLRPSSNHRFETMGLEHLFKTL